MVQWCFLCGTTVMGAIAGVVVFFLIGCVCRAIDEQQDFDWPQVKVLVIVGAIIGVFFGMGAGVFYIETLRHAVQVGGAMV